MSIGRNDPCPCGSGKKYKRCCGAARKEASTLELVPGSADDNPCRDQVWEADVVPVPIALDDDPAARPAGVLVVSGDQILAHDFMGQAPAEPEALAGILEEAVRRAAAEAGGLPGALWVRHESIKTALAAASGLKTVRLAAATSLPALDQAAMALIQHLTGAERPHRIAGTETWRGWGLPSGMIVDVFKAAAAYYRAEPWSVLLNEQVVDIRTPTGRSWTACTLGNGGNEFGLALYADREDFFRQVEAPTDVDAIEAIRGELVSLVFNSPTEIPRRMAKEVLAKGWEVAGPDAYPTLFPINTPGGGVSRQHVKDLTLALAVIPRFVERFRDVLLSRVSPPQPIHWRDDATGTELSYQGDTLPTEPPLWPVPERLSCALPTGAAAVPEAALASPELEYLSQEHDAALSRFRAALERQGLSAGTVERHTANVGSLLDFLSGSQGIPVNAVTEYDLRVFLFDWYLRKVIAREADVRAMPTSIKRFVAFLRGSEAVDWPWAAAVLQDRDAFEVRWRSFPGGFFWDEAVQQWQGGLYGDLDARVLLPDPGMAGGGRWGATMGIAEAGLSRELERRWLLWRDDVIGGGVSEPATVRAELVRRQRAWETTPHAEHGGATPVEAVLRERDESPSREELAQDGEREDHDAEASAASPVEELRRVLASQQFGSLEETQAFLDARTARYNTTPQEDFGGLSPLEMHTLLQGNWLTGGPLRLAADLGLDELQGADYLVNARTFLQALLDQDGTRATAAGNLSRKFVGDMLERMRWPDGYVSEVREMNKVINEDDVFPLHVLRLVLSLAKCIRVRKKEFRITGVGKDLVKEPNAGLLYNLVFRTFFRRLALAYLDGAPENPALQETLAFSFYRLSTLAADWRQPETLVDEILIEGARQRPSELHWLDAPEWQVRARIVRPLISFGLLERRDLPGDDAWSRPFEVRKSPLFDRFITFDFDAIEEPRGR